VIGGGQAFYFFCQLNIFTTMDEVIIANRSLARLGARSITSLSDTSAEAVACNLVYAAVRDELLRSHRWNFARKRAALTKLIDAPAFEYACQYDLPADCLRLMEINDVDAWDTLPPVFEIEGRKILTDADTLQIKYIYRATDANLFDVLFVRTLVLALAAEIAEKVTGSSQLASQMLQEKESLILGNARKIDANESRSKHSTLPTAQNSAFIRARFSGS
jgi:hypothetical protein